MLQVELDVTEDEIKAAVQDDTTKPQAIEPTSNEDAADSDSSNAAGEADKKEQKTELWCACASIFLPTLRRLGQLDKIP